MTDLISNQVLTLPMYPNMTDEEKTYVVDSIAEFFENNGINE
jgi:dTDP-4-amino-4,6-dideoxygalactose transaminase